MGACHNKGKNPQHEKQKSLISIESDQHKIPTEIRPNSILQASPDVLDKALSQKPTGRVSKKEIENIFSVKFHKLPLSKYYSAIQHQPYKQSQNRKVVQHNMTGKMKELEILEKEIIENNEYVEKLKAFNLSHPHLVSIYEVFQDARYFFLILDYCNGGYLKDLQIEPHQETQVLQILDQILNLFIFFESKKVKLQAVTIHHFSLMNDANSIWIKFNNTRAILQNAEFDSTCLPYQSPQQIGQHGASKPTFDFKDYSWTLGVIAYQLISGVLPFTGQTEQQIKSAIKRGVVDLTQNCFADTSEGLLSLIKELLKPNASQRISLVQASKSKCFNQLREQNQTLKKALTISDKGKSISLLQSLFLQFMIKQYCSDQQQQLFHQFQEHDQNGDGKLSRQELFEAYKKQMGSAEEAQEYVDKIFQVIDIDNSGDIDFQEFVIATTDKQSLLTKQNLKQCFRLMANSQGFITPKRLATFFTTKKEEIEEYFQKYKSESKIRHQEFQDIMLSLL